jgi:hypothetical protein
MTFLGMGAGVAGTSTRDVVDSGMLLIYPHSTEYAIPAGVPGEHAAAASQLSISGQPNAGHHSCSQNLIY